MESSLPYILMIETSTLVGSIALYKSDQLLGYLEYRKPKAHAQLIMPMIQTLLNDMDLHQSDLDAVAVSKGPGSYTGLRVGVATAKGLCMALDKPLLAIDSLTTISWQVQEMAAQSKAWICPMIDARRMEVYTTLYGSNMQPKMDIQAKVIDESAFADILNQQKIIFAGDGVAKCKPILDQYENAIVLTSVHASAAHLGIPLFQLYQQHDFEDLVSFEPFYLKDFVATKPRKRW